MFAQEVGVTVNCLCETHTLANSGFGVFAGIQCVHALGSENFDKNRLSF